MDLETETGQMGVATNGKMSVANKDHSFTSSSRLVIDRFFFFPLSSFFHG